MFKHTILTLFIMCIPTMLLAAEPQDTLRWMIDSGYYSNGEAKSERLFFHHVDQGIKQQCKQLRVNANGISAKMKSYLTCKSLRKFVKHELKEQIKQHGGIEAMLRAEMTKYDTLPPPDKWDELDTHDAVINGAVAIAVTSIIVVGGAPLAGAAAAIGSVALGSLAAAMLSAAFQKGPYWENVKRGFNVNFRIAAAFLGVGSVVGILSGGLSGAGGNWLAGYVTTSNSVGQGGSLTLGPAMVLNGNGAMMAHEFGHTLQFMALSLGLGKWGPYAPWAGYLALGGLGTTSAGKWWEELANLLGGYKGGVWWL